MSFLELINYTKSFGTHEVLKGIDFTVEKGEVVSIIGSSGSGKSTLLRCLNFLETPNTGVMMLDGNLLFDAERDGGKAGESSLREKRLNFGLVFQAFHLFPQYNVLENITLAPLLALEERVDNYKKELKEDKTLSRKQRRDTLSEYKAREKSKILAQARELLEQIGMGDRGKAYPCELSGGQCQRVAIARALALEPKILCFDEPTSALDPELTDEVLKVIRSLKDKDRTMIIVTHEMAFASSVSDKVIFMADGVIEEVGTPEEIFGAPKSEKLVQFLSHSSVSQRHLHEI